MAPNNNSVGDNVIAEQIFQNLLQYNTSDQLQQFGEQYLTKGEIDYTLRICQTIHSQLQAKHKSQYDLKSKMTEQQNEVNKINQIPINSRTLAHHAVLEQHRKNLDLFNTLPQHQKITYMEYQKQITSASMLMLRTSYNQYKSKFEAKRFQLQPPSNAVVTAGTVTPAAAATNNNNSMDVDTLDEFEEEYFKTFNEYLQLSLDPIRLPSNIISIASYLEEQKLGVLVAKVCQIGADRILEQRNLQRTTGTRSDDDLNEVSYQIVEKGVNSIFSSLSHLQSLINQKKTLSSRELEHLGILQNGELLKDLIELHIPSSLNDPSNILKIGDILLSKEQFQHVLLVADRARLRLKDINEYQDMMAQINKREKELELDIQSISKVGGKPEAQELELKELRAKKQLESLQPTHMNIDKHVKGNLVLQIAQLRVRCALQMKKVKGTLNIDKQLDETLDTLIDPTHIFKLAQTLQQHKENEATIRYGERCQQYMSDLEKLREVRLPLQQLVDKIQEEERTLRFQGSQLTKSQQDKLNDAKEKLSKLPDWPYFGELTVRHQYDNLHLEIAQVMISSVLDSKKALENSDDEKRKALIDTQFDKLVQLCLDKFHDPAYLLKFASHMRNTQEDKVVLRITTQLFKRCNEIEEMRKQRLGVEKRLKTVQDDIPKLQGDKQIAMLNKKKEIEKELEDLPVWPHYAQLQVDKQFDTVKYEASLSLMTSLLNCYSFLEEKIRKKKLHSLKSLGDDATLQKEKDNLNARISESLLLCLSNIENPDSIVKLATDLGGKRDSLFIEISRLFHPRLEDFYKNSVEYRKTQQLVKLLENEQVELSSMKKDMTEEDLQLLDKKREELIANGSRLPYLQQYLNAHEYHSKMLLLGLKVVYDARTSLYSKIATGEIPQQEGDQLLAQSKANIQFIFEQIEKFVENPETLIELLNSLLTRKESTRLEQVGVLAFSRLNQFREVQRQLQEVEKEKRVLMDEKEQLDKQRRRLAQDKHKQLRSLIHREQDILASPNYVREDANKNVLVISNILINSVSKEKTDFEATIGHMTEEQLRQVPAQRKKLLNQISETTKLCVGYINSLQTLMKFADDLFQKKEYLLVIQVGKIIEDILDKKREMIEEKERLDKDLKNLQQKFLQTNDVRERTQLQTDIDRTSAQFESVVPPFTYDQIKEFTITISGTMIKAANFEDLGEEIRDQSIISFKIDPIVEKWDTIRNLSSEEEWAKIKEELVVYVMKREENINSKIELLLKDGLYKQCIEIFPHPSTEEAELSAQMELLENLYETLDKHQFSLLPKVLPIVQRYAKRCYQEWKSEKLDPLYDLLQRRYPQEIKSIFEKAIDMLLVNILQSQYPNLMNMLKEFKKRMVVTLGLQTLWDNFLEDFKKKNKTKKRLIQMIGLIGESVWQIEQPNVGSNQKKRSNAKTPTSTPSATKKKKPISAPGYPVPSLTNDITFNNNNNDNEDEEMPSTPIQDEDDM